MSEIIHIRQSNITQFINKATGENIQMTKPFEQAIYLIDVHIAGTTHIEEIDELVLGLAVGDKLRFQRDKDNPFDQLAIKVMDNDGNRLGFIPCDNNEILARLMDGGKLLYGEIAKMELLDRWHKITMQVFLDD
ncbi:MAG: HIRAN domain-containing protein [Coriobacteriales bacterium]|nr:HIRAN domain-containing protein [Coriobacteriales bacterium]